MFEFCLPTRAKIVPDSPDWLHEIKYDGYRLRVDRDGDRVRLITRSGYNWTDYPWIVEAARKRGRLEGIFLSPFSRARSDRTCFARLASSGWKVSFP
jgi:ATP-dependent DNA ligase